MQNTDKTLIQLKRIRGQVDGVIKMYESGKDCISIVRQILAVRNSLGSVLKNILFGEAKRCNIEKDTEELNKILHEAFKN